MWRLTLMRVHLRYPPMLKSMPKAVLVAVSALTWNQWEGGRCHIEVYPLFASIRHLGVDVDGTPLKHRLKFFNTLWRCHASWSSQSPLFGCPVHHLVGKTPREGRKPWGKKMRSLFGGIASIYDKLQWQSRSLSGSVLALATDREFLPRSVQSILQE